MAPSALPSAVGASPPGHFIPYGVWPEGLSEAVLPEAVEQAVAQAGTACTPSSVEIAGMDCASYPCLLAISASASMEQRFTVVQGGLCTLQGVELKPQTYRLFRDSDYFEAVYAVVDPMHPPPQGMEHRIAMEARMAELRYVALPKE